MWVLLLEGTVVPAGVGGIVVALDVNRIDRNNGEAIPTVGIAFRLRQPVTVDQSGWRAWWW